MNPEERRRKALEILSRLSGTPVEAITPEMDLVADLHIDSPKALELLVDLEEELEIEISDEDAARMDSVVDVLGFLDTL